MIIPEGWRFYSADFSREDHPGRVTLVLAGQHRKVWTMLSDVDRDRFPLFVSGYGNTIEEALEAAKKEIIS